MQPAADLSLEDWWNTSLAGLSKENRRSKAAILIYTAWNIWKARNRQVFDHLFANTAAGTAGDQEEDCSPEEGERRREVFLVSMLSSAPVLFELLSFFHTIYLY